MHPAEIKVGDLIKTEFGLAQIMKFFAPAFIGCVVLEGPDQGSWIYLRGFNLEKAELICGNS